MDALKIENAVSKLATPVIENLGYEVVEVEFLESDENNILTIFIYKEDGIVIADCEKVARSLDILLDELNPTNDVPYSLNISSPGLDRPLKTLRDFQRNLGEELQIDFLKENKTKTIKGILKKQENNNLIINSKGKIIKIALEQILKAIIVIKF